MDEDQDATRPPRRFGWMLIVVSLVPLAIIVVTEWLLR
jgi:hypothetical protein